MDLYQSAIVAPILDAGGGGGSPGPEGPPGPVGPQGPIGPEGPQGPAGPEGKAGPKGDKGDKGDTGPEGPQGPAGPGGGGGSLTIGTKTQGGVTKLYPDIGAIVFEDDMVDIKPDNLDPRTIRIPLGVSTFDDTGVTNISNGLNAKYPRQTNRGKLVYCTLSKTWWGCGTQWRQIASYDEAPELSNLLVRYASDSTNNTVGYDFLSKSNQDAIGTYVAYVPSTHVDDVPTPRRDYFLESYGSKANGFGIQLLHDSTDGKTYTRYWDSSAREWETWKEPTVNGISADMAVFPSEYKDEHYLTLTDGLAGKSGIFKANSVDLGLPAGNEGNIIVTKHENSEEHQTFICEAGVYTRTISQTNKPNWSAIQSGSGGSGASSFVDLPDTPADYTGQAGMLLGVNAAEDGLEYIIDSAIPIMQDLEDGNLPIKWNNMKQKIAASSSSITQTNIAENAFTIGLGGSANRQYQLPDIVEADTSPLPPNSVREGRLTIISQQGGGIRTVVLNNDCKFVIGGTTTTTDKTIPPGEAWILLPAIYGNGDKCWSLIGTFSANNQYPTLHNGYTRIGGRSVSHGIHFAATQINQGSLVNVGLAGNSGGTVRYCILPDILPFGHDGWIENHQVRHGKEITFTPIGSANTILRPSAGQQWWIDGSIETGDRTITPGIIEKFIGIHLDGVQTWFMLSRTRTDGSSIEIDAHNTRLENLEARPVFDDEYKTKIDDLEARPQFTDEYKTKIDDLEARPQFTDSDKELIDGLTNGETWISPKCISTPTSLISNATPTTVTMDQVAQGQTIVLNGAAAVTVRLCKVVSVSMSNIQTDEVKSGTEIKIYNFGTSDAQIESNTAGIDMVGFGSTGSTRIRTLPTGKYAKFMSVSTGSGYGWAYLESGDCPSMT